MTELLQDVLAQTLIPLLAGLVLAMIGWATTAARTFLLERTKQISNELVRGALEHLTIAATTAAAETAQIAVDDLKAAAADGKLTREEAGAALSNAAKRTWQALSADVKELLLSLVGGDQSAAIEQLVKPAVEAAVRSQKALEPSGERITSEVAAAREAALARARLGLQ